MQRGRLTVCIREIQKSLKESAKRTIETQLRLHGLGEADGFHSLKSLEGYHCAWVEQAEMLSQASFDISRPTIRAPNSELWFSWNPRRGADPVDAFFRQGAMPANAVCVMANWRDNQWFNKTMDAERLECLNNQPEQYDHIWEGDYQRSLPAYYAAALTAARGSGRKWKRGIIPPLHE
jgi:phage terminase large subunit